MIKSAPTLTTDRLTIAPMTLDHWENYATAWADPRMTQFIGGKPRTRNESWGKFLQGNGMWSLFSYGYWSFLDRDTGGFLGNGGLAQFERGIPALEGYPEAGWAFAPDFSGRGLATEAMTAILDWADSNLADSEIRCIIDPDNIASCNVAEKLGFSYFGEAKDPVGRVSLFRRRRAD
ncbi:MAG: GNAT family N-acetyltransferase [Sphingorhabdus sp.]